MLKHLNLTLIRCWSPRLQQLPAAMQLMCYLLLTSWLQLVIRILLVYATRRLSLVATASVVGFVLVHHLHLRLFFSMLECHSTRQYQEGPLQALQLFRKMLLDLRD